MAPNKPFFLLLTLLSCNYLSTVDSAGRIDGVVRRNLEKFPTTSVLVQFGAEHIGRAIDNHRSMRRSARSAKLTQPEVTAYIDNLNRIANEYQASVLAYLKSNVCGAGSGGDFCRDIDYFQLYISNEIAIRNADQALINRIASMPNVTEILPDEKRTPMCGGTTTTEAPIVYPPIGYQLNMMQAKQMWDRSYTGFGVTVGIIDSGVSLEHPTVLTANYRGNTYGWFDASSDKSQQPVDGDVHSGHGTCVLSLAVGGNDENGKPVGVAPRTSWIACKDRELNSQGPESGLGRKCMEWIACPTLPDGSMRDCSWRPDIVNHSFGWDYTQTLDANYFKIYEDVSVLVVQAAGNVGPACDVITAEGDFDWPIVVGCVDENRRVSEYSSRGPSKSGKIRPHLMAPGHYVRCLNPKKDKDGKWFKYSLGTSTAAPLVTGLAAVIKSYKPLMYNLDLKSAIIRGALYNYSRTGASYEKQCGSRLIIDNPNNHYGYGIANALESYCLTKKNKFPSITELLGESPQRLESPCGE